MSKPFLTILLLFVPFSFVVSQTTNNKEKEILTFKVRKNQTINVINNNVNEFDFLSFYNGDPNRIDTIDNGHAEVRSTFPGGDKAMKQFITQNLKYPSKYKQSAIKTRLYVKFVVDTTGQIVNPKVLKNILDREYEEEVIRLMKSMPKWIPGKSQGNVIAVYDLLSIGFGLD